MGQRYGSTKTGEGAPEGRAPRRSAWTAKAEPSACHEERPPLTWHRLPERQRCAAGLQPQDAAAPPATPSQEDAAEQAVAVGNPGFVAPEHFAELFSTHGSIMIFFMAMPFLTGLINYLVPLQIGDRDVAFPVLNAISLWLTAAGRPS